LEDAEAQRQPLVKKLLKIKEEWDEIVCEAHAYAISAILDKVSVNEAIFVVPDLPQSSL